jgi:hypothetical protein
MWLSIVQIMDMRKHMLILFLISMLVGKRKNEKVIRKGKN